MIPTTKTIVEKSDLKFLGSVNVEKLSALTERKSSLNLKSRGLFRYEVTALYLVLLQRFVRPSIPCQLTFNRFIRRFINERLKLYTIILKCQVLFSM